MKNIAGLTCTNGRFTYLRRLLTSFLQQDYENKFLLIYNNAKTPIIMEPHRDVLLVNNHKDLQTGADYRDVGSIYRDALTLLPADIELVSMMDDDDFFLPHHFKMANNAFCNERNIKVWKPGMFFFMESSGVTLMESNNNLEGSCVIERRFLDEAQFNLSSLEYNLKWLRKASESNQLFVDTEIVTPSFCYDVSQSDVIHTGSFCTHFGENKELLEENIRRHGNYGSDKLKPWETTFFEKYVNLLFDINDYR